MSNHNHSPNLSTGRGEGAAQPSPSNFNLSSAPGVASGAGKLTARAKASLSKAEASNDVLATELESNVSKLWADSKSRDTEAKLGDAEAKKVKLALHAELSALKYYLVKAGRDGRWRSFLKEADINRASADRWVNKHRELTEPKPASCLHEASTLTEAELSKLARDWAKKLIKRLRTPEQVTVFVARFSASLSSSLAPASDPSGQ